MAFKSHPIYRVIFSGDTDKCKEFIGVGRRQMEILKNHMSFQKLTCDKRQYQVNNDVSITADVHHNRHKIYIWCRPIEEEVLEKKCEKDCLCSCCFAETSIIRVGGTERDAEGEIEFQGDYAWGDPRLRYDILICYKKEPKCYEFYLVENVRPSDYTQYQVGDQCLVMLTTSEAISKCSTCDDCGEKPEAIDTLCKKIKSVDLDDLIILPISVTDYFEIVNYTPLLEITEDEFRLLCISTCEVQDVQYPVGGTLTYDTVDLLTLEGIYGGFSAPVKYNGYTGQVKSNQMPSCAFRPLDDVIVIHKPTITDIDVTYTHTVICHVSSSLPTRVINGTTRLVPFNDVLYLWVKGYNDSFGEAAYYLFDVLRGELADVFDTYTHEEIIQPLSFNDFFYQWQEEGWANRAAVHNLTPTPQWNSPCIAVDPDEELICKSINPEPEFTFIYDELNIGRAYSSFIWVNSEHFTGTLGFWYYPWGHESSCRDGGSTYQSTLIGAGGGWTVTPECFFYQCNDQHVAVPGSTFIGGGTCESGGCVRDQQSPYAPTPESSKKYNYAVQICAKVVSFSVRDNTNQYSDAEECTSEIYSFKFTDGTDEIDLFTKNIADQVYNYGSGQYQMDWSFTCFYAQLFRNKYTVPPLGSEPEWDLVIHSTLATLGATDNAFYINLNVGRFQFCNLYGCFDLSFKTLVNVNYDLEGSNLLYLNPGQNAGNSYTNIFDGTLNLIELGEVAGANFITTGRLSNASSLLEDFIDVNISPKFHSRRSDLLDGSESATEWDEYLKTCDNEVKIVLGFC